MLSFWVKSNKTGTYTSRIYIKGQSSTVTMIAAYTISSSATWEKKTISIPAYTTSLAMKTTHTDNGCSIDWGLASGPDDVTSAFSWTTGTAAKAVTGQVNLLDTINNYWQVTGIQFEIGSIATEFEHRSYEEELVKCKRYYELIEPTDGWAMWSWQTDEGGSIMFFNEKRATPTASIIGNIANGVSPGSGSIGAYGVGGWRSLTSLSVSTTRKNSTRIFCGGMNLANAGDSFGLYFKTNTGIRLEAEL